jgi:sirohydrochlorin cobaltochelatase
MKNRTGILLFAHGSRDEQWREPFMAIFSKVCDLHNGPVSLAFLEYMKPDFIDSIAELVDAEVTIIRVVPLFLAAGGHVRSCLPNLVHHAQEQYPTVSFHTLPPLGESTTLIDAFATFATSAPNLQDEVKKVN